MEIIADVIKPNERVRLTESTVRSVVLDFMRNKLDLPYGFQYKDGLVLKNSVEKLKDGSFQPTTEVVREMSDADCAFDVLINHLQLK